MGYGSNEFNVQSPSGGGGAYGVVTVHVAFERQILKPVMGQLDSTCSAPPRDAAS
jgi:hypothetical protein